MIEVSVVVPTRNRGQRLAALLDALHAQTLAAERYEVVLVDDASTDVTPSMLASARESWGPRLRVVRHEVRAGRAAARDAGWRVAQGKVIAFTDDDCVPTAGWLEEGLRRLGGESTALVQGRVEPNPDEVAHHSPFTHTILVEELTPGFETANMFYPREVLERLGGFDAEAFPMAGEDMDLAWRAIEAGAKPLFAEDAVVYHGVLRIGALGRLRLAARWSESIAVFRRHPEVRRHVPHRIFWNQNHWLLTRALVGLLLPRRLGPVRLMLAAPYVAKITDRRSGPLLAPYLILLDLVEMGAVIRGAIRHRTLVL